MKGLRSSGDSGQATKSMPVSACPLRSSSGASSHSHTRLTRSSHDGSLLRNHCTNRSKRVPCSRLSTDSATIRANSSSTFDMGPPTRSSKCSHCKQASTEHANGNPMIWQCERKKRTTLKGISSVALYPCRTSGHFASPGTSASASPTPSTSAQYSIGWS